MVRILLVLVVLVCRHWQRIHTSALIHHHHHRQQQQQQQLPDHICMDTKDLTAVYDFDILSLIYLTTMGDFTFDLT